MDEYRRALDPPRQTVVALDRNLLRETRDYAQQSPRRRVVQPFHKSHDEPLHRMLNAVEPGTYVQPHRHVAPPKAEAFVVLSGAIDFLIFADDGELAEVLPMRADGDIFGVDVAPGPYHAFLVREPGTVLYEVKGGPFEASSDKDFAPWAPAEGDPGCAQYQETLDRRVEMWLSAEMG